MTQTKLFTLAIAILGVSLLSAVFIALQSNQAIGAAQDGTSANVVSATTTTVGPQSKVTLFERNGNCDARIVTTNEDAINITFQEATGFGAAQLSPNAGHYQAGSTTVVYDSGLYGCGKMSALGLVATGTVTITETQ